MLVFDRGTTVDGSRNPANSPVEVGTWNPIIYGGFYTNTYMNGLFFF